QADTNGWPNTDTNIKAKATSEQSDDWQRVTFEYTTFNWWSNTTESNVWVLVIQNTADDGNPAYIDNVSFKEKLVEIDYKSEQLVNFGSDVEGTAFSYNIDRETVSPSDNTVSIADGWFGKAITIERSQNSAVMTTQTLTIPARPEAPTGIAAATDGSGKISGITTDMEYSSDQTSWTPITDAEMIFTLNTTYYIRTKATDSAFASNYTSVMPTEASKTAETISDGDITINYADETIGFSNGTYTVNGTDVTNNSAAIQSEWFGTSVSVVKKASDESHTDSAVYNLSIPARPDAPTNTEVVISQPTANSAKGSVTAKTDGLEYSAEENGAYRELTKDSAVEIDGGATVYVRWAATNSAFRSDAISKTINTYTSPDGKPLISGGDFETATLTKINWSFTSNDTWYASEDVAITDADSYSGIKAVKINGGIGYRVAISPNCKYRLTAHVKSIGGETLYVVRGSDSTPGTNSGSKSVASVTLPTSGEWENISVDYDSGDTTETSVVIYMWDTTETYIDDLNFNLIEQKEETPNIGINYTDEILTGFTAGGKYKIGSVDQSFDEEETTLAVDNSWFGKTDANALSIIKIGSGKQTEGYTITDSSAQLLGIPNRPDAPTSSDVEVAAPKTLDGKGSITAKIDGLEYSETKSGIYTSLTKDNPTEVAGGTNVYVRKAAVKDISFKSETYEIKVPAYDKKQYTVTFNTDGGSDIQPQKVTEGEKAQAPTSPTKSGYTFGGWQLNGEAYSFDTAVTGDITLTAQWTAIDYSISKTTTINGSVTLSKDKANIGDEITITVRPDTGYKLASLTVKGENVTEQVSYNTYTFNMPADNVEVSATFEKTAVKSITVTGPSIVTKGQTATYTAIVKDEYETDVTEIYKDAIEWSVTGGTVNDTRIEKNSTDGSKAALTLGTEESGTDSIVNVVAAIDVKSGTLPVEIKAEQYYSITADNAKGGLISLSKTSEKAEETVTFSVTANDGYTLAANSVEVNGGTVTVSEKDGIYSFTMPHNEVIITAVFTANEQSITGTIIGGSFKVYMVDDSNVTTMVSTIPTDGKFIVVPEPTTADSILTTPVAVSGASAGAETTVTGAVEGTYVIYTMGASGAAVSGEYTVKSYTVSKAAASDGNSFTVSSDAAPSGTEITVIPSAVTGYEVDKVYIYPTDNVSDKTEVVNRNDAYKFVITADTTVEVIFKKLKYTITWKNWDETILIETEVEYGDVPSYPNPDPTKPGDNYYNYIFSGWTPEIAETTDNVTYTATFTAETKEPPKTFLELLEGFNSWLRIEKKALADSDEVLLTVTKDETSQNEIPTISAYIAVYDNGILKSVKKNDFEGNEVTLSKPEETGDYKIFIWTEKYEPVTAPITAETLGNNKLF
ncbi:MAG: InlB B-repeat-containing protein, partial [Hominilimicola sp.]